jgi:hypothetical protein
MLGMPFRISDPVTGSHFTSFTLGTCLMQTMVFMVISLIRTSDSNLSTIREELENPKSEARSTKWFDKLTTLSHVEGQYPMIQIRMTKTAGRYTSVFDIGAFEF